MLRICIVFLIVTQAINLRAGCVQSAYATVNNVSIFTASLPPDTPVIYMGWAGKSYVDSVSGNVFGASAHVYFHRGDTVYLSGVGAITQPGVYIGQCDVCESVLYCGEYFVCSYLPDTLEAYYYYHFDQRVQDSLRATTGIPAISAEQINMYPNPVKFVLQMQCDCGGTEAELQVYDVQGRFVLSRQLAFSSSDQTQTVDMSSISPGTYIVSYFINGRQYRRQIIKL